MRLSLTINRKRELNAPSDFIKTLAFWWPITGLNYYDSYIDQMQKVTLAGIKNYVRKYLLNKPYIEASLMSPENAKKLGLKDTAQKYLDKFYPKQKDPQKPTAKTTANKFN